MPPLTDEEVLGDVIFTGAQIRRRVRELGRRITQDYQPEEVRLVTVLKGGVFFLADLARAIRCPVSLDFLAITSYAGESPHGEVRFTKDLDESIVDRHVLIVEDVIDTGLTLGYIHRVLEQRRPASLKICILFDRPYRRLVDLPIDYVGFDLPDLFVVGYGLDYRQRYRNLPEIRAVRPEALALPEP